MHIDRQRFFGAVRDAAAKGLTARDAIAKALTPPTRDALQQIRDEWEEPERTGGNTEICHQWNEDPFNNNGNAVAQICHEWRDAWSPEARKAAAEARKAKSGGGVFPGSSREEEIARSRRTIEAHTKRAERYRAAGKSDKAALHENVAERHRQLLRKWGAK